MLVARRFRAGRPDAGDSGAVRGGDGGSGGGLCGGWRDEVRDAAESALAAQVSDGVHATGGQAAVYVDGDLVADTASGVTGSGQPMRPDHLHHGFCMLKPLPFLVLAAVVEEAGFGPDDPLDEMAEMPEWCPDGLTVRTLGSHEAGLGQPPMWQWFMARPGSRPGMLARASEDREPAYSDWAAPLAADHAIGRLTGRRAADYCTEALLEPRGLADDIVFSRPGEGVPGGPRLQCAVAGLPLRAVPMFVLMLCEPDTASFAAGGVMAMRGVAGVYSAVGEVMGGKPVEGLPSPGMLSDLTAPEHLEHSPTQKRRSVWAAGLIHDLGQANISNAAGPGSVGHMGGASGGTAVFDPTRRASCAVWVNGANGSFRDMEMARLVPMDRILRAVPTSGERQDR